MHVATELYREENGLNMNDTSLNINHNEFDRSSELQITKVTTTDNKTSDKRNMKRCSSANPLSLVNLGLAKEQ